MNETQGSSVHEAAFRLSDLKTGPNAYATSDYLCEFVMDTRSQELLLRLEEYYSITEDLDNRQASEYWYNFKSWANLSGYSRSEINNAKVVASGVSSSNRKGASIQREV